ALPDALPISIDDWNGFPDLHFIHYEVFGQLVQGDHGTAKDPHRYESVFFHHILLGFLRINDTAASWTNIIFTARQTLCSGEVPAAFTAFTFCMFNFDAYSIVFRTVFETVHDFHL